MTQRRYVLLDRDGTLIVEKHYLSDPDGVELIEGAAEALRELAVAGLGLVVVTNQSAIGRGYFDPDRLATIHRRLGDLLAAEDVRLDGIYYCPHHPDDGCACRKPRPGMVERAASELGFDPASSFVVGDAAGDICLGAAVGATTILVRTGHGQSTLDSGEVRPDHTVSDVRAAAACIKAILAEPHR